MKKYILLSICVLCGLSMSAQTTNQEVKKSKKAWELGLGGTVMQFSRIGFSDFNQITNGYSFNLDLNHAVWGGGIYAARELNQHFYLDFQGSLGFTNKVIESKNKMMAMAGLGLQFRLGEYFHSKYIDPYLRAGLNYMYKDFDIIYTGSEGISPDQMDWILKNYKNKDGYDKKHMMPITVGGGLNLWMNDHLGIGLQADYVIMPYKNVANSIQGSARIIWRIGGSTKKTAPVIQYVDRDVDRVVEKVVEKEVIVEKPIEKVVNDTLVDLFNQIYFEFNSSTLSAKSEAVLDNIARIFNSDTSRRYLITGQTDAKGSAQYNKDLSQRRADSVVNELKKRNVPADMLKSRGVGMVIAAAAPSASNEIRQGDRKTTIELVTNMDYWNYLK